MNISVRQCSITLRVPVTIMVHLSTMVPVHATSDGVAPTVTHVRLTTMEKLVPFVCVISSSFRFSAHR
jgi:hypothetical protein